MPVLELGFWVSREHEAGGAAGARHLAGPRAVRAVVDQARGEHLLLRPRREVERDRERETFSSFVPKSEGSNKKLLAFLSPVSPFSSAAFFLRWFPSLSYQ